MSQVSNQPGPDWDKLPLPDEYHKALKDLQDDREKLRRIRAVGQAFIYYMRSPIYADTEGELLEAAFFMLCEEGR